MAQRFIAVSEYARNAYLQWGIPPELVSISYNPVDVDVFKPDPVRRAQVRAEFGIPEDAIVMGFAGRVHAGKGVVHLMKAANEAMAVQPRLHALWVGAGVDEGRLQQMAAEQGLSGRHHFTGWVNDTERYYGAFSFLAFPSIKPETFGRVAIEAQASGVPVLGSDIGGIPETMQDQVTGYLIEPGNVSAWRDRILDLCDEQRCRELGAAARSYVTEHFGNAAVARDFEALLRHRNVPFQHLGHAAS
jgi:glycosyltransferase involved in cell wall biosynthesis